MPTSNAIVPPHLKLFACLYAIVTIQCARRSISIVIDVRQQCSMHEI